jgi:mannose-6-phosphate isomerase-like protein (cupin superfamily)
MNAKLEIKMAETLYLMEQNQELKKDVISNLYDLTKNYTQGKVDKLIKENLEKSLNTDKDKEFILNLKRFFNEESQFLIEMTQNDSTFKLCDGWYGELITKSGKLHTFDIFKKIGEKGKPLLRHKHEFANKTIVIISGEATIITENRYFSFIKKQKTLKEGQSLFIKSNTYHTIIPKTNVKLLSIFRPPIIT